MIVDSAVFTLGSITLPDKKIKVKKNTNFCVSDKRFGLIFAETSLFDQKIHYHENRAYLFCLSIYSCPMKTHHSSGAHICGLSKAVQNCIIYNYYLEQMQCFRTKNSIPVTPLTHDVTSASKLR